MSKLRAIALRIVGLFGGRRSEDEFTAELESHVAMHTDDGVRAGLAPAEARRQALVKLGGAEQVRQAHRERRALPWLESLLRDFGYGLRTLGKHRGATAIAILSIGLGIGANATIFSIVSRFVLRPAPVGDPSTLLAIHTSHDGEQCCNSFSLPLFQDLRDQAKSFSGVAAYYELLPASIGGGQEPQRIWGQAVTPNFFDVLEMPMIVGRGFISSDNLNPAALQPCVYCGGRGSGCLSQRRSDPGCTVLGAARDHRAACCESPGAKFAGISLDRRGGEASAWGHAEPGWC